MSTHDADRPGAGPWRLATPPAGFERFPEVDVAGSVGRRFRQMASAHPDRVAVSSPAGRWTYRETSERVERLAGGVQGLVGIDQAHPVAVLAVHDGPLVTAILGIIVAGHVVVVLDPAAPQEQTVATLDEIGDVALVHDEALADLAAALVAAASREVTAVALADLGGPFEPVERTATDPLMLAFTSGTSGAPKGAIITHGVLLNLVRGATDALGVTPEDRMPMLFPTSLAVAAYPMFIPLLNGATLATLDVRGVGLEPVADFLEQERITLAYMAPTVVRFLVDALAGRTFPDLRLVALGGELVDAEVIGLTAELFGPTWMANGFGTTETGVITLYVIDPADPPAGAVPAGYPVDDVELLVLDDDGRSVPVGHSGEVAVVSPHVFSGYWAHPELSQQVLSTDPAGRPGWRLYRTGDLGRIDEHGALVVLGRMDTKVKVRGRFVVLGDVEADIHELAEVNDAVVVTTTDAGVVSLRALVVPAEGTSPSPTSLRTALLARREAYSVPTEWRLVPELPRLPNGKLDRRAAAASLATTERVVASPPSPTAATARGAGAERDPDSLAEILRIWTDLLPIGPVGSDDEFLVLGGDSLLAAQMLIVVERRLGVTVPMGELVHARTARQLATVVDRLRSVSPDRRQSPAACVQVGDESARPRLWFVHDLQGSAYRVRHVAEHLGADQPVWSFESPLLAGAPPVAADLEQFAADYVEALRISQPDGPYWLAGYSFGGICAYEMARQLTAAGQTVRFLGVVDVGPGYRGPGWHGSRSPLRPWFGIAKPPPPGTSLLDRVRFYRDMAGDGPARIARHLEVRTGIYRHTDPLRFRRDLRSHGRVRPDWRLWYAWEEHWRLAATAWDRASAYAGAMDLFWAEDTPAADATMGWGALVDDLQIHRFVGDHEGVLEPRGAYALAVVLRAVLDDRLRV